MTAALTAAQFFWMCVRFWRAGWRVERFSSANPHGNRDEWIVVWGRGK